MVRVLAYACGLALFAWLMSITQFSQDATERGEDYAVAARILRSPALSPDGKQLAFVYDGDIWSVESGGGTARRLTITLDNDGSPCYSPDGKQLAFRSRRYGSDDVFVMPASGGEARRLTFSDGGEDPCCWLPDGSGILFSAARDNGRDLWVVRAEGGEPWPVSGGGMGVHESGAAISQDGKHIAYVSHGADPMRRRGYFGTSSSDIWLCDFDGTSTRNHRALVASRSHEDYPCFMDNNTVLFVSCAAGKSKSLRQGRLSAVTLDGAEAKGWGGDNALDARDLTVGGGRLAFATGNYGGWRLHVGELGKRPPTKLNTPEIRIESDVRSADVKSLRLNAASEYDISPDGKKIAFVAGGDVFLLPTEEGGVPRQLTNTVEREKDVKWDSDSRTLAYSSRKGGAWRVYGVDAATGKEAFVRSQGAQVSRAQFMPGGKRLASIVDEQRLNVELPDGKTLDVKAYLAGANMGSGEAFDVSPDGQWILFEQPNEIYDDTLFVANLKSGEAQQISHMFGTCTSASFTRDGKRVVFACDQEGNFDIYALDLVAPPVEFKEDKLDKLFKEPAKAAGGDEKKDEPKGDDGKPDEPKKEEPKKPAAKKPPETKIDFDGLKRRVRRITSLEGNEFNPICLDDGKTFYFLAAVQGQSNLWKLTLDPDKGPDLKQITQSRSQKSRLKLSPDEKSLWFLDSGTITSFQLQSGKTTSYGFSVEQRRLTRELRAEALSEARWIMGSYFYDKRHHGQKWDALCDRYAQALDSTSTGDEFGVVMNELLGELNSSHQGFYAADERSDGLTEACGYLGARFDALALARGEYRIVEILKGGPLDIPDGPQPGILLVGVNGKPLGKGSVLARELINTAGRKTILHLNDKTVFDGARELAVKPISRSAEAQLHYERWVDGQRAMVHKLSGGRLGYVHIEGMDEPSLRHFKHHLGNDVIGKEGLVIDVRYNGGGYTAVDVLEILIKRPWLKRQSPGFSEVSENAYRSVTLEKPSVLLINQDSFSNAEILAEGFRRLGIGKIVGVDTAGGVIGTGQVRLIDGSSIRLPGTGAFTVDGENLENNGRKPDIFVQNSPEELDSGIDRQTEAAVKALLEQIANSKGK